MFDYNSKKQKADSLLEKYGQPAKLVAYQMKNGDPTQMELTVLDDGILAIMSNPKEENLPASLIGQSVGLLTCTVSKNLYDVDHYIQWNGQNYKIKYVSVTNLTNEALVAQLYVLTSGG